MANVTGAAAAAGHDVKSGYNDVVSQTKKIGIDPIGHLTDPIGNLPGGLGKPARADLSQINDATGRAFKTQDELAAERAAYGGQTAPQANIVRLDPTYINQLRQQQQNALLNLTAAANGMTPSAAELQANRMAQQGAANQFGIASALQGGMSAGGALRMAQQGSQQAQGDALVNGVALRAQEQANARNALVNALGGMRGQETDLSSANANLAQGTNLANLGAQVNTNQQDIDWRKALLAGQMGALGSGVTGASAAANASAADAAGQNAYKGGLIKTGASAIPIIGSLIG